MPEDRDLARLEARLREVSARTLEALAQARRQEALLNALAVSVLRTAFALRELEDADGASRHWTGDRQE